MSYVTSSIAPATPGDALVKRSPAFAHLCAVINRQSGTMCDVSAQWKHALTSRLTCAVDAEHT